MVVLRTSTKASVLDACIHVIQSLGELLHEEQMSSGNAHAYAKPDQN